MKRIASIVLSLSLLAGLGGCGAKHTYSHKEYFPDGSVAKSYEVAVIDHTSDVKASSIFLRLPDGTILYAGDMSRSPNAVVAQQWGDIGGKTVDLLGNVMKLMIPLL